MPGAEKPSIGASGTEALLGRLQVNVATIAKREAGAAVGRQANRQFEVLAAEARSNAPLPDLAKAAGFGLIRLSVEWGDLEGEVTDTVEQLIAIVDERAGHDTRVISGHERTDAIATADANEDVAFGEAEDPETDFGVGAAGVGGPITTGREGVGGPILTGKGDG